MLFISKHGHVDAERVIVKIFPQIERGAMTKVNGIAVHQTNGSTAQSAFGSYSQKNANGAHFLIDKDGKIYQTASLLKRTNHVGKLKSRCLATLRCSPIELKTVTAMQHQYQRLSNHEHKKRWPDRYPSNMDSIGIEIVGMAHYQEGLPQTEDNKLFEEVNALQNASLSWLLKELTETFGIRTSEIHRHPILSYKNKTEASTAKW